jgi:hypothetical protein
MFASAIERAGGDEGAARAHVEAAVTLARRSQHPYRIAQALDTFARVTLRHDQPAARAAHAEMVELERAHPYLERVQDTHLRAVLTSAELTLAEHRSREALPALREAAVHASEQHLFLAIRAPLLLAQALSDLDRPDPAATLVGFATQSPYSWSLTLTVGPDDQAEFQLRQSQLRTQMGDRAYNTAIAKGAALSRDQIGAFMVAAIDDVTGHSI